MWDSNYLQFDKKFYKAKTGLAIGGRLSPKLAEFVMNDILEEVVYQLGYDPTLLVKYVDDILLIGPIDEIENTFNIFNNINSTIKFTIEHESSNKINYLDMQLIRNENGKISTNFYQKPTNKGRLLNFKSNHPWHQRINTANNLINRIFKLSSIEFRKSNIDLAVKLLIKNSYPSHVIHTLISKFITSENRSTQQQNQHNQNFNQTQQTKSYIGCNYINNLSENLSKLFQKYNKDSTIAYKTNNNVKQLHNGKKDSINKMEKSGLIYSMDCTQCEKLYVGQTGQFLEKRMYQHQQDYKNRQKLAQKHHTAAIDHSLSTGHSFDYKNPKILHMEKLFSRRNTLEMIYIKKHQENTVNIRTEIEKLSSAYHQLIITP